MSLNTCSRCRHSTMSDSTNDQAGQSGLTTARRLFLSIPFESRMTILCDSDLSVLTFDVDRFLALDYESAEGEYPQQSGSTDGA